MISHVIQSILEMQVATITVESKYGTGTKFIIKFPVKVLKHVNKEEVLSNDNNHLERHVEKIKIEFSDIYK